MSNIIDNFKEYKKNSPQYKIWKKERNKTEAKRLAYVSRNNLNENTNKEDIKRAKIVLNAIDIMDEYSQTRAEDTELIINQIKEAIIQISTYITMPIGFLISIKTKFGKNIMKKFPDEMMGAMAIPIILTAMAGILQSIALSPWSAKKETTASRNGRFEAMKNELSDIHQFALLNDNQEKEVQEIAKTIKISKKEAKKLNNAGRNFGILKSFKTIFTEDEKLENERKEFSKNLKSNELKSQNIQLTQEEIEEAKKDKQLIQNIVEKIDIASQEYAENTEFATGVFETFAFGTGGIASFLLNKITKLLKLSPKTSKNITYASLLISTLLTSFIATKIQKDASRVARYKIKQDFINNPQKVFYVDDEKAKNEDETKFLKEDKKTNMLTFIFQAFKDNKEYNKYLKEENVKQKQLSKAKNQINLTSEQKTRAHQLQQNIFKMFDKSDEKSQKYSESTEALGEIVQSITYYIATILFMISTSKSIGKANFNKNSIIEPIKTIAIPFLKYMLPAILFDRVITHFQKDASKVANMLAINEMDDYRNFADYSNKTEKNNISAENKNITKNKTITPPWEKK